MKRIVQVMIVVLFVGLSWGLAQVYQSAQTGQMISEKEWQALLEAMESVAPYPASETPARGTFYSAQFGNHWPPSPANMLGLPFWPLGDGHYIYDDRYVDYGALRELRLRESRSGGGAYAMDSGPEIPGLGGPGGRSSGVGGGGGGDRGPKLPTMPAICGWRLWA
jgi:hypothetical protein